MRPIDADVLKDYFHMGGDETSCEGCEHLKRHGCYEERLLSDFCAAIDEQPTIDAVPVIRCKDCTYWDSEITQTAVPNMRSCIYWGRIGTLGIDYCSRAVRKEE